MESETLLLHKKKQLSKLWQRSIILIMKEKMKKMISEAGFSKFCNNASVNKSFVYIIMFRVHNKICFFLQYEVEIITLICNCLVCFEF